MDFIRGSFIAVLLLAFIGQAFAMPAVVCSMSDNQNEFMQMMNMDDMQHHQHMQDVDSDMTSDDCCKIDCECSMMGCHFMPLAALNSYYLTSLLQRAKFHFVDVSPDDLILSNLYRPPISTPV